MKQPWEWDEDDILAMISNGVKESLVLDYKASDALRRNDDRKKTEVSKDISAFANSAGGTIVYGIKEDKLVPVAIDSGYDPTDISKEWLEQVINSQIQRRIDGVRINQVELSKSQPGKVIYVVHILQSNRAPHMAGDHRFYKRFNFQSVPMEEYEVRDVARRLEVPDLRLIFHQPKLGAEMPLVFESDQPLSTPIQLDMSIMNDASAPAEYALIRLLVDAKIRVVSHAGLNKKEAILQLDNERVSVNVLEMGWGKFQAFPIWEGIPFGFTQEPIKLAFPRANDTYLVGWQLDSPGMPQKTKLYVFRSTDSSLILIGPVENVQVANLRSV